MKLTNRIINNALNRRRAFTTAQVAKTTGASARHTRRVIALLVAGQELVRTTRTTLLVPVLGR